MILVAVVGIALYTLRDRLPSAADVWAAVTTASPGWLLLGLLCEWVSLAMFARQQMWLLRGLGVPVGIGQALAMTYSRSAIAITMPAGSAVSAGFAYQSFRRWGASREAATTVMLLSGFFSILGLLVLYVVGYVLIVLEDPAATWTRRPIATVLAILAFGALVGALTASFANDRIRAAQQRLAGDRRVPGASEVPPAPEPPEPPERAERAEPPERAPGRWRLRERRLELLTLLRDVVRVAFHGMHGRYRRIALLFAIGNWLTDLCCLAAVAHAFHLPLTLVELGTVYVIVQLVRQIPVTPGGIGVIEASLLAALVSAGAGQAPAAAAVLGYRLFSCWLIIPAGLLTWALLRRSDRPAAADPLTLSAQPTDPAPAPR